jgi:hypothetical protein
VLWSPALGCDVNRLTVVLLVIVTLLLGVLIGQNMSALPRVSGPVQNVQPASSAACNDAQTRRINAESSSTRPGGDSGAAIIARSEARRVVATAEADIARYC